MKRLLFAALLACAPFAARAQVTSPAPAQTCAPVTGVLAAAGASVTATCPGAASYIVQVVTTTSQSALVGTFTSTDSVTGGNRLLFKTGVGELDVSTIALDGTQGAMEYRAVGSGTTGGEKIALSAYTSGSATVTIYGAYASNIVFENAPVHSSDEAALRRGRAFTATTGIQTVAAGSYETALFTNPAGSGWRAILVERDLQCDTPTANVAPKWYSIQNPTTNLPATAGVISNRRTGGSASTLSFAYAISSTSYPDTSPTTALTARLGGTVPTGGAPRQITQLRTIEPGNSYAISILSTANGLGTSPMCSIDVVWYEEQTN